MVDWKSAEVEGFCAFMFAQMTIFILGSFLWYLTLTLPDVELGLLARRIKFRLAHLPYLIGRYFHLASLIIIVHLSRSENPITCQDIHLARALAVLSNVALTAASGNLAIRALAIWKHNIYVTGLIILLCVGHLVFAVALGLLGIYRDWDPRHKSCTMDTNGSKGGLFAFYLSTVAVDISILILTIVGVRSQQHKREASSPLWSTLINQGIAYAIVTCITCIPMAVMAHLDLNYSMNIFFAVPGCTISVMASSAVVTSLFSFREAETTKPSAVYRKQSPHRDKTQPNTEFGSDQLTTNIGLSTSDYINSCDIVDGRFDMSIVDAEVPPTADREEGA